MQQAAIALLANAALLGLRHGTDWDHIAAITDITGTASSTTTRRALALSSLYAIGHATIVIALGVMALYFSTILPAWVDSIMERLVGATLIMLGGWILYALFKRASDFELKSRWMIVFSAIACAWNWLWRLKRKRQSRIQQYGPRTAFGVGMIHGIGAETGTQVLLLAAMGGTHDHTFGLSMLLAFTVGLLLSNAAIALLSAKGFASALKLKPIYMLMAALTGCFSIYVGAVFITGTKLFG